MLIDKEVTIKWNSKNKKWLEERGYIYTKIGDEVKVKIEDLQKGSHVRIKVKCDYCNKIFYKKFFQYIEWKNKNIIGKDCCEKCQPLKNKEVIRVKYDVDNVFQLEEVKEKAKDTNIKKYNAENPMQNKEIQNKARITCRNKYGKDYYTQTIEYKERVKKTNLDKYGVENVAQAPEFKEKSIQTNLKRYGVKYPLQNEECLRKTHNTNIKIYGFHTPLLNERIRQKIKQTNLQKYNCQSPLGSKIVRKKIKETIRRKYNVDNISQCFAIKNKKIKSMYKNGTIPTSSQQQAIYEMLKENNDVVEINYPFSCIALDIALFIDDIKIDIEYDSWYWHKNEQNYDRRRDEFLKSKGWKILRIKSNKIIPDFQKIQETINKLLTTDRQYTEIVLDDWGKEVY